ncbi:hypothetical protein VNO77_22745 [Canavalia gladiata]|uniref:Uncharacterized protein n=1 Tax=Canavalia gladiata TaxID=3824 RepID=A0AAN9L4L6_CANGL
MSLKNLRKPNQYRYSINTPLHTFQSSISIEKDLLCNPVKYGLSKDHLNTGKLEASVRVESWSSGQVKLAKAKNNEMSEDSSGVRTKNRVRSTRGVPNARKFLAEHVGNDSRRRLWLVWLERKERNKALFISCTVHEAHKGMDIRIRTVPLKEERRVKAS